MSEENPVFKVTDRRLFNADGSPREIEQEENAETKKAPDAEPAAKAQAAVSSKPAAESEAAVKKEEPTESGAEIGSEPATAASANEEAATEEDYADADIPGANDPASFINFLMSIAQNAAAALGMMEHPITHERTVDLELGKHWIDVLGMLQKKTQGNLAPQEQQIFEGLLADLRMQYVSLNTAPQAKASRGFSGSDITGGK